MKKLVSLAMVGAIGMTSALGVVTPINTLQPVNVYANTNEITVNVDGENIDFSKYGAYPYIENGTTMLPFRSIFEAFPNGTIDDTMYDTLKAITFKQTEGNMKWILTVNQNAEKELGMQELSYNDDGSYTRKSFSLDAPAINKDGRLFVPARAISESLGYSVSWNENTKTVSIDTSNRNINFPDDTATRYFEASNYDDVDTTTSKDIDETETTDSNEDMFYVSDEEKQAQAEEMLGYVNDLRVENGLNELELDQNLTDFAYLKANDYRLGGYSYDAVADDGATSYHVSPRYGSPSEYYNEVYGTDYGIGENLAIHGVKGDNKAKSAFNAWLDSEGHLENMLYPNYTKLGFGFAKTNDDPKSYETIMLLEMR